MRLDNPSIVEKIRSDGFAVIGSVIDAGIVASMRHALQRAIDEDLARWSENPWYGDHWMVHNLMLRDPVFMAFLENPTMHAYLAQLLSPSGILYAYTSSSLPPQGSNYSRRIHVDAQAQCVDCVTNVGVLVALDDFTDANGATAYLPGSHRRLETPDAAHFDAHAARVYPRAGEAVMFNARTFHRGGENTTGVARHAISLNACQRWMKQRFDYPRMLSEQQVAGLGSLGRRFVGIDSRVPVSLEQYYVAPEQRLYKTAEQ
jgi:ectoine hydroxylase-related dioxygenase (phytanoyl-CoA dioxygenase family)